MNVRYRPYHTGWCTEGRCAACPKTVTVTRTDEQGTYEKSWTCACACHGEEHHE